MRTTGVPLLAGPAVLLLTHGRYILPIKGCGTLRPHRNKEGCGALRAERNKEGRCPSHRAASVSGFTLAKARLSGSRLRSSAVSVRGRNVVLPTSLPMPNGLAHQRQWILTELPSIERLLRCLSCYASLSNKARLVTFDANLVCHGNLPNGRTAKFTPSRRSLSVAKNGPGITAPSGHKGFKPGK